MNKKRWQAGLCILGLAILLGLPSLASAAPNLIGVYTGNVPKITTAGCSNVSVNLAITQQCTNQVSGNVLFSGNVIVGSSNPIPIIGKLTGTTSTNPYLNISGNLSGTTYISVSLSGNYVSGTTPSILGTYVYYYSSVDNQNSFYDNYTLVKQLP
jgi:hypothetical protein